MSVLGLVTVLYNCPEVLFEFFESLAAQTDGNWHLEVIDNSSDEISISVARECAEKLGITNVVFTRNSENVGVAKANNQGITNCLNLGHEYIVLLNNDIVFGKNLLAQVRVCLEAGHALVAPRILYHDTGKLWYAGGRIRPIAATVEHIRDRQHVSANDLTVHNTGYAPTCFLGVRCEVFQKVGLMDERYFVYYDDTDFVYRCLKEHFQVLYLGSAELRHKVSSSTGGGGSEFSIYYYNRNRLFFIRKNYQAAERFVGFFWYYLTRCFKYLIYDASRRKVLLRAMRDAPRMAR